MILTESKVPNQAVEQYRSGLLFGLSGTCAKCRQKIPPDELVMRCQDHVYHMNCFICVQCHTPLHPGDKVCAVNGSLFCEHEFPHLFSPHCPPTGISLTSLKNARLNAHSTGNSQSDIIRGLAVQKSLNNSTSMNTIAGGGRSNAANSALVRSSPGQMQLGPGMDSSQGIGMDMSCSILPITQSELAAAMNNSHPSSPSFPYNNGTTITSTSTISSNMCNQNFVDRSPSSAPGMCLSDVADSSAFNGATSDPMTLVSNMVPEKSVKMSGSGTQSSASSDAPTGRKKQKVGDGSLAGAV
ncbi:unnamed protein product [Echinostoma caproni]|uniref:LIM zinc-binding domain-containing protein n=1 Tax=Echinostoma caproni TaxID=27848 RepID=A0A183AYJ0_9TREM|nr:unnamed protein product [Echinostoma caproni]